MTPVDNRLQVRLAGDTPAWLDGRSNRMHTGSRDIQARLELGMWQSALQAELRRMRFTVAELNCMADAMNGTLMQPAMALSVPLVYADLADTFAIAREHDPLGISSYGAKWEIDERALLDKVIALGPTADHALHDAISRWWEGDHESTAKGWAEVGLRVAA